MATVVDFMPACLSGGRLKRGDYEQRRKRCTEEALAE